MYIKNPSKKIAILQSNYIPWKGYFELINSVDEFIIYDDVQYTKNDWRNRNMIKSSHGKQWLTIPVHASINQLIKETKVANTHWTRKHWKSLTLNYSKSTYFNQYADLFEELYSECQSIQLLSHINYKFITKICALLDIQTKLSWSMDYPLNAEDCGDKTSRLIALCKKVKATCYLSGPGGRRYINEKLFQLANIELKYIDYEGYPSYSQLYGNFENNVSILDLIFNTGKRAITYMSRNI